LTGSARSDFPVAFHPQAQLFISPGSNDEFCRNWILFL
jgi:hypothetical protein